ncbi:hypothetical protein [Pontibacillus marinus]|uniref:Uncharacterized protein n=1 Tax=Pontibacillus marinus BH030004 = DSM 16465 TaxID=1385511 RepID=A0A0A5GDF7_9BACI|nr:hypothetical protein [Pontibacillus marinus]KGX91256.1 hypothetical protein N783_10950 [Pontibacillus marinus BH030004 = DSM 16465]
MKKPLLLITIVGIGLITLFTFKTSLGNDDIKVEFNQEIHQTKSMKELNTTLTKMGYDVWDKKMLFIVSEKSDPNPPIVNYTRKSDIAVYDIYNMKSITSALKILELDYDIDLTKKAMEKILTMRSKKDEYLSYKGVTFQFFDSKIGDEPFSTGIQFF